MKKCSKGKTNGFLEDKVSVAYQNFERWNFKILRGPSERFKITTDLHTKVFKRHI